MQPFPQAAPERSATQLPTNLKSGNKKAAGLRAPLVYRNSLGRAERNPNGDPAATSTRRSTPVHEVPEEPRARREPTVKQPDRTGARGLGASGM